MADSPKFYFRGFVLTLHKESYLVEVRPGDQEMAAIGSISDLPDWIFNSRLASWLTEKSAPIHQRAIEGEQIRNLLTSYAKKSCA